MARKIQLNSAYGAIGNQYFRYYKLANAEAIKIIFIQVDSLTRKTFGLGIILGRGLLAVTVLFFH